MGISNKYRFGEIIPMSRADIAAGTITLDIYDQLSEGEQDKCLKRDFIWKAPNVKKLKKEGANMNLVYWQNEIRKSLYPKPSRFFEGYQRRYMDIVTMVRDIVMDSDAIGKVYVDGRPADFTSWARQQFMQDGRINRDDAVAVGYGLFFDWTPEKVRKLVERERFGYTDDEKISKEIEERIRAFRFMGDLPDTGAENGKIYYDSKHWQESKPFTLVYSAGKVFYYPDVKPSVVNSYIILDMKARQFKKVDVRTEDLMQELDSCKDELRIMLSSVAAAPTSKRKTKFVPELAAVKQENGSSEGNIQPEDYLDRLKFRGGEWGNWLNEAEREQNLTMCFNSFKNLCQVLGLPEEFASLQGTLSIAFGSRGHGNASAHFEPGNNVINLTKMKGAGCLAHEWGHALDHYIAKRYEIPFELATEARYAFMKSDGTKAGHYIKTADILPSEFTEVTSAINSAKEFLMGSKEFDKRFSKQGGYWSSKCEMWARAFDCYVHDKLTEAGITDTYLSRGSDSFKTEVDGKVYRAYPTGEERERINTAFDHLMTALR